MSEETSKTTRAVYRVVINAPIETVWDTLVKTDEVLPFFFGAVCDTEDGLKVGAPMRMISKNRRYAAVIGEVLEFSPPHRYAHTMKFTQYEDAPCTVIYDLKETPDGVEFSLITENVPVGSKTDKAMSSGGKYIVNTLKQVAERGRPSLLTRMMLGMMGLMAPFTPKACRIENWPLRASDPDLKIVQEGQQNG